MAKTTEATECSESFLSPTGSLHIASKIHKESINSAKVHTQFVPSKTGERPRLIKTNLSVTHEQNEFYESDNPNTSEFFEDSSALSRNNRQLPYKSLDAKPNSQYTQKLELLRLRTV